MLIGLSVDRSSIEISREHVFGPPHTLALLYLASGPLPNAANSNDVPTEFAAKNTSKMKSEEHRWQLDQINTWVFFRGEMYLNRRKNYGCGQKKTRRY